jgi:hypothetical protein
MRDLASNVGVEQSLAPANLNNDATGSDIDRLGFESATFLVHIGAFGGSGVFGIYLEDSDDGDDWDEVSTDHIVGVTTFPDELPSDGLYALAIRADDGESPTNSTLQNTTARFGYVGGRRHVRPKVDMIEAGNVFIGIDVVLGHALRRPV